MLKSTRRDSDNRNRTEKGGKAPEIETKSRTATQENCHRTQTETRGLTMPFNKRSESTREILAEFCQKHLDLGIRAVKNLKKEKVFQIGEVLSFEW